MRQPSLNRLFVAGVLLALLISAGWWRRHSQRQAGSGSDSLNVVARQLREIQRVEGEANRNAWAQERLAEECGHVVDDFWDRLNASSNKLQCAASLNAAAIAIPLFGAVQALPHGIELREQSGVNGSWDSSGWRELLAEAEKKGWQLVQAEFRHLAFDVDPRGRPAHSRYYWSAHLTNASRPERAILEGYLDVFWEPAEAKGGGVKILRIAPTDVSLRRRTGELPFREVMNRTVVPPNGSYFIDPLILYDLDGDGYSEIILAAKNLVLHRRTNGTYEERPLCEQSPGIIFTGIIADFDGDGVADFLCAKFEGLWLFKGSPEGRFSDSGRLVWAATPHLKYAQALTCGDVDGDGDLDVWLGQYKPPYDRGQMPSPFYDANDGYPSYLLLNDGHGNFTDNTVRAGLGTKRWRRTYSASFVDLNHDHHLDLVVANDFAGVEINANDGRGQFTAVTDQWIPEHRSFGMAQLCADFDGDGRMDLLLIGMNVSVLDRLLHAHLSRPGYEHYLEMGKQMACGNRLFQAQAAVGFRQTSLNGAIARTGWSWGATAADLDNDGFPDLYIANGHETKQSVRDYETEFWLHDIYVGTSQDNLPAFAYFRSQSEQTRGRGMSYGGNERNRLFFNQGGSNFMEAAHLMGVALAEDSRTVVADDLDLDGRMDLLVTTFEARPEPRQTLRVFANRLPEVGHWIGFRLREGGPGLSPVGARVTVRSGDKQWVQSVIAGDSYRSQRANTVHIGLGGIAAVDWAEVLFLNGRSIKLLHPDVDRYHTIPAPAQ